MAINFYAEEIDMPSFRKNDTKEWIKEITTSFGKKVEIFLMSSATMRKFLK